MKTELKTGDIVQVRKDGAWSLAWVIRSASDNSQATAAVATDDTYRVQRDGVTILEHNPTTAPGPFTVVPCSGPCGGRMPRMCLNASGLCAKCAAVSK